MSNLGPSVLAIDTSSRRGSIALGREGRVVAAFGLETSDQQSAVLWGDVEMLLGRAGLAIDAVAGIAVCRGPGSFTGLRVGIAAAAGLARAAGVPLYGATSLELAARGAGAAARIWSVLNAYRGEVYAQELAVEADGTVVALGDPVVDSPATVFSSFPSVPIRIVGDGAERYIEQLRAEASTRGIRLTRPVVSAPIEECWQVVPSAEFRAAELARLASGWLTAGLQGGPIEPCYIRPSEAEINLRRGRIEPAGRVGAG